MAKNLGSGNFSHIKNLGVPNTFPGTYKSSGGNSGKDSTGPKKNVPGPMGPTKKGSMSFKNKDINMSFPQIPSSYTPIKGYSGKGNKAGSK